MNSVRAFEIRSGVALLRLDHRPVNTLSGDVRRKLLGELLEAEGDSGVQAVVIAGARGLFSAGADITEFLHGTALASPTLEHIHALIATFSKPVVAAIEGCAVGGALELALACHGRVASADAVLGLPEVTLGLMPGAGGTQRLPRALGLERALNMIVGGTTHPAREFAGTALLDQVVGPDVVTAACEFALGMAQRGPPFPLLLQMKVEHPQPQGLLGYARAKAAARPDYTRGMSDAIDAMEFVFTASAEEGCAREHAMFRALLGGEESGARLYAFLAERAAPKLVSPQLVSPELDGETLTISRAGVVGSGFMGAGIAACLAKAGIAVALFDVDANAAARVISRIREESRGTAKIAQVASFAELADADLVIEAAPERLDLKCEIFRELDRHVGSTGILASNTSTLDINLLARAISRPQRFLGLHFFAPAESMRLLEVVRGTATSSEALSSGLALAKRIGKVAVLAGATPGFIGNRIFDQMLSQALAMVAEGVLPWEIDSALEKWGLRMGPFRAMDLIGNDVLASARAGRPVTPGTAIADRLVAAGRLGQKSGRGWYRYAPGSRRAIVDRSVKSDLPPTAKAFEPRMMVDRCILPLVNEGARVMEEGIAQRASDIDVVFLLGYGFPRSRGGPMFYADRRGLALVKRELCRLHARTGDPFWAPAPLLERVATEQGRFTAMRIV